MGKNRQKKFRSNRPRPTGLPSVRESEEDLQNTICNRSIQNLVEKVTSPSEDERECSCTTIANLVSQPSAIFTLLQHNIVRILAPLVVDHSSQVRIKALGALRNLSVDGGEEVCQQMVRKDVLTPLVALFKQYGAGWQPEKLQSKRYANIKTEIFIEATHLLWNLCECSDEAMGVFNKEGLVSVMWPCLQPDVYGMDVATTVAQCIHTISEDNPQLSEICRQAEMLRLLENLLAQSSYLLQMLSSGILINVCGSQYVVENRDMATAILRTVSQVLAVDAADMLNTAAEDVSQVKINGDVQTSVLEGQTEDPVNLKVQEVSSILSAQQVALEILANLCCSEDEDWEDMDSSESSCDEVIGEVSMETEGESSVQDHSIMSPFSVSPEILAAFKEEEIFSKVLLKAKSVNAQEDCQKLKSSHLQKSFDRLQEHALLCLNNLISALDPTVLGGLDGLHEVWQGLVQLSTTKEAIQKGSLLEAVTSAIRAVVEKLAELQSPKLLSVGPADLQYLFEMGQQCQYREVRVHAVRIVSTIGVLLSKNPQPHPLLKNIGMFLLETACKDGELWVVAEALDCVFDVFSEDHLDVIDQEIRLTERLKQLIPVLKSKINSAKKSMGEHYPVISTAKTNLIRFVKYKTSLRNN